MGEVGKVVYFILFHLLPFRGSRELFPMDGPVSIQPDKLQGKHEGQSEIQQKGRNGSERMGFYPERNGSFNLGFFPCHAGT